MPPISVTAEHWIVVEQKWSIGTASNLQLDWATNPENNMVQVGLCTRPGTKSATLVNTPPCFASPLPRPTADEHLSCFASVVRGESEVECINKIRNDNGNTG